MPTPGIYLVNATGEVSALATEDGGGDHDLFREALREHDIDGVTVTDRELTGWRVIRVDEGPGVGGMPEHCDRCDGELAPGRDTHIVEYENGVFYEIGRSCRDELPSVGEVDQTAGGWTLRRGTR